MSTFSRVQDKNTAELASLLLCSICYLGSKSWDRRQVFKALYLKEPGFPGPLTLLSRMDTTKGSPFRNLHEPPAKALLAHCEVLPLILYKIKVNKFSKQYDTLKKILQYTSKTPHTLFRISKHSNQTKYDGRPRA